MSSARCAGRLLAVAALCLPPGSAAALSLDVPGTHPTLQAAVAAAAISMDVDNTITISVSPLVTNAVIDIGAAFGPARRLTIRPAAALPRASIVNGNPTIPIFNLTSAGHVALQDLDILRNITNGHHLVVISTCADIVVERCRIGSNWPTTGTPGWANVYLTYPTDVTLRNNILFARTAGTFDHGLFATNFNDPANALRLYNNVAADYRVSGIRIGAGVPGSLVLLRNNVAVNHAALAPEPVAYRTEVLAGGSTVVTSHNTAFASAGFIETGPGGAVDIAGLALSFLTFAKAASAAAFVSQTWAAAPPWDANAGLFHLVAGGPLHDDAGDYGLIVTNTLPDFAVVDDIDREVRPGGPGPHSDRGVDQIEAGAISGVAVVPPGGDGLRAEVRQTAGEGLSVDFVAPRAGRLELTVYDVTGRLLGRTERRVSAAEQGSLRIDGLRWRAGGMIFYRLRLEAMVGGYAETTGSARIGR